MSQLPEIQKIIYDYVFEQGKLQEKERILHEIDELEKQSHKTRTPLFQQTMFEKVRQIVQDGL